MPRHLQFFILRCMNLKQKSWPCDIEKHILKSEKYYRTKAVSQTAVLSYLYPAF